MDAAPAAEVGAPHERRTQEEDNTSALNTADEALDSAAAGENKFQKAISAWRNINLTKLIPSLDTAASDLVAHQRDALVERKDLAQKTKDFRKLDDVGKLAEIKAILKAYQTYIDFVTNQSKTISSSFLQVYSAISEAPDPYPLLEASVESLVVADEIVPKLEAENKHLQGNTTKLTLQLEDAERRWEEERRLRVTIEESRDTKIKEVEATWSAVLAEKQDNWEARERNLEERTENQERLLKELKASYEVTQRLERGEEVDVLHQGGPAAAELEIVSSDLERTSLRLAEVESRNEQLRLELAQSASQIGAAGAANVVEEDPGFLRLRSENSSLLRKVDAARFEREADKRSWETTARGLKKDITALTQDSDALRAKIQSWHDYDDIKRELEILKSIEFATAEGDEMPGIEEQGTDGGTSIADGMDSDRNPNLEQLLLARNKKLNSELTILRVSHQDLASRLETLQEDLSNTNMELEKSRNLTAILENDLARVQSGLSSPQSTMSVAGGAYSVAGTHSSRYQRRRGRASPTSSIISGFDPLQSPSLENIRAGEPIGGGSGILPMIAAQRDRFKKRISDLEAELSKTYQTVSSLRSEVASLQKDNLNLYEKTRYVSTYNRGPSTTSSSAYGANPNPSTIHVSDGGESSPIDRYRSAYESRISPFAAFRGRESARAFRRMNLPERAIFQITKMVLATRTSRNLFAMYCLGLHVMVFFMLYSSGTADIERHVTHLADASGATGVVAAGLDSGWHQDGFADAG